LTLATTLVCLRKFFESTQCINLLEKIQPIFICGRFVLGFFEITSTVLSMWLDLTKCSFGPEQQVESAIPRLEEIETVLKDTIQNDHSEKTSQRSVTSSATNSRSNSVSYIDELPAVPTHAPIIRKAPLQPPQHPPPPVPATKPAWTAPHVQPPPPRVTPVDRPLTVGGTVVPQLQSNHSASSSIPLPSLTKNTFPLSSIINPDELAKLLGKRDDPPSILLLDIRPRDVYKRGCICHKWVVQLEPMVLKRE
jgi:hypothetical protein